MIRRTLTRRTRAAVLIAAIYLAAGFLAWSVNEAARWEIRTAQHGPVRPAPDPTAR